MRTPLKFETPTASMLLDTSIDFGAGGADIVAQIIIDEVHKRTLVTWRVNDARAANHVSLSLNPGMSHAEKYFIMRRNAQHYVIEGKTTRALIYGAGKFMRCLQLGYTQEYDTPYTPTIRMKSDVTFPISSTPAYTWRGHQIAYRPKTHNYDALTSEQMQQEILDQVLFGCNVIEMIPPKLDDCQQSPHFTEPWTERLSKMSAWCDLLDVKVSMWYPAFPGADWRETYKSMKRFDILFIPGGDPGGRAAPEFFRIVREHAHVVREYFPDVEIWVSSQYGLAMSPDLDLKPWNPKEKLEEFYQHVPLNLDLLNGIVYGPWTADEPKEFRRRIPKELPIRHYPDLCHNLKSQHIVGPRWDFPFAATYCRESINPRPRYYAQVFRTDMPHFRYGSGCYSEGSGDDVNKAVWTGMLWGETDERRIMDEYAEWFIGTREAAPLIFALEDNWAKPLRSGQVVATLKQVL